MKKKAVKATITLNGKAHEIMISKERAEQIKRLQKLIKENNSTKKEPTA
jgi:hypothetical protein